MNMEDDILIVDDEIPNLRLLTELLEKEGYQVRPAEKAQTAIDSALAKPPGLILLDVRMPEMDGFEVCRRLKQDERTRHVPVIFVSALDDIEAKIQGFEAGGVDYISKPFQEQEILARVKTHMSLFRMQQHLEQLVEERTAEVAEIETQFWSFVENANETIVVTQDAVMKYCNLKISELTGYSQEEMHSQNFEKFIHPEDLDVVMREYRARVSGEKPTSSYSIRIITKDGQEKHVFANSALVDWSGRPATLAMLTDITEQELARKELKQSEQHFRNLMEQSPLAIAIFTPEGQITEVNTAWMREWGLDEEEKAEVVARYNMLTDKQLEVLGLAPLVKRGFAGESVVLPPIEYHGNRTIDELGLEGIEAKSRWIQSHLYSVLDEDGGIAYVVASNIDITELKIVEEELRTNEKRLSLIYESVAEILFYIKVEPDDCFRFSSVNPAFLESTGLTEDQIIGKRIEEVIPEKAIQLVMNNYMKSIKQNEIVVWEETSTYPAGEKTGVVSIAPVLDENGSCIYLVGSVHDITERKQNEIKLRGAYEEIEQLKNQLEAESAYLQEEIKLEQNFENIIGQSEALKYVLHRIEQVAPMDSSVLIMGETGTGKELVARALHELSPQGKRALVKVNCAALPAELIESELFGREKGAFTGATTTQVGRFELARGSTLFLDEIGELPLELQAKLLRVLESGEFERLGSPRTLNSDARIIAATNRVLEEEVADGRFREDLWYRLNVFTITVPPLREHPEDIPLLVKWFMDQLTRKMGKRKSEIPKRAMQMLKSYPWPGNVRELKHAIESALITAQGKKLEFDLPQIADTAFSDFKSFEEMEREYILRVLKAKNWRIGGKNSAASTLGMNVNTLRGRMKKLGIKKPKPQ